MQPPIHQQREDLQKREEAKREEQDRQKLEAQLQRFDAYSFYDKIGSWADKKTPEPVSKSVRVSLLHTKTLVEQPVPLTRKELYEMRDLSTDCTQLLSLLRAIDQRGIECPYVHQMHKQTIEKAITKCDDLQNAHDRIEKGEGLFSLFKRLLSMSLMVTMKKDVALLKQKLESLVMICRHQEFAQDLMKLRRAVTYRTGALLGPDDQPQVRRPPPRQPPPRSPLPSRPPSRLGPSPNSPTNSSKP